MINETPIRLRRRKIIRFLWLSTLLLLGAGLALIVWSVKRSLDLGFHYRMPGMVVTTSHVTKVELSPELERDGLRIAHFGDVFEWHDVLLVSRQRRLVLLAIEANEDIPAADLLYTLYDANNVPLGTGKLHAVTEAGDVVSVNNLMCDDQKRYVVYGPHGSAGWHATHLIIDDNITTANRAAIHR
jgi:hypothetical protein